MGRRRVMWVGWGTVCLLPLPALPPLPSSLPPTQARYALLPQWYYPVRGYYTVLLCYIVLLPSAALLPSVYSHWKPQPYPCFVLSVLSWFTPLYACRWVCECGDLGCDGAHGRRRGVHTGLRRRGEGGRRQCRVPACLHACIPTFMPTYPLSSPK